MMHSMLRLAGLCLVGGCAEPVYGDGQIITYDADVDAVTRIVADRVNVKVVVGEDWGVSVVADWNIFPHVLVYTEDDALFIELDEEAPLFPTTLEVQISTPALSAAQHTGGSDLFVTGLDEPSLSIYADDSGNTELVGSVDVLSLKLLGTGVRNAHDLIADEVDIDAVTSGTMWVIAREQISGALYGSGDLNVFGKPTVRNVDVLGSGEVHYF
jgi:hypothetical protein